MISEQEIDQHLSNLDIKLVEKKPLTFTNQKIKADVIEVIAELIIRYIEDNDNYFSAPELRENTGNNEIISRTFSKPLTDDPLAAREMDKFFSQPCSYLAFYKILELKKENNRNYYTVLRKDILEYLSKNTLNSLNFIISANKKFVNSNLELKEPFNKFFTIQDRETFTKAKDAFIKFVKKYTDIKEEFEPKRVFTPFFNSLAYDLRKNGTLRGKLSPRAIVYSELKYNRPNFYDESIDLPVGVTRQEYLPIYIAGLNEQDGLDAEERSAIRKVKRYHNQISEYSGSENAVETHHMFTRSSFESLRSYKENLINITPDEHRIKAHPNSNFVVVDEKFQIELLLAKLKSILADQNFYDLKLFIYILNTGFSEQLDNNASADEVKNFLMKRLKTIN